MFPLRLQGRAYSNSAFVRSTYCHQYCICYARQFQAKTGRRRCQSARRAFDESLPHSMGRSIPLVGYWKTRAHPAFFLLVLYSVDEETTMQYYRVSYRLLNRPPHPRLYARQARSFLLHDRMFWTTFCVAALVHRLCQLVALSNYTKRFFVRPLFLKGKCLNINYH